MAFGVPNIAVESSEKIGLSRKPTNAKSTTNRRSVFLFPGYCSFYQQCWEHHFAQYVCLGLCNWKFFLGKIHKGWLRFCKMSEHWCFQLTVREGVRLNLVLHRGMNTKDSLDLNTKSKNGLSNISDSNIVKKTASSWQSNQRCLHKLLLTRYCRKRSLTTFLSYFSSLDLDFWHIVRAELFAKE